MNHSSALQVSSVFGARIATPELSPLVRVPRPVILELLGKPSLALASNLLWSCRRNVSKRRPASDSFLFLLSFSVLLVCILSSTRTRRRTTTLDHTLAEASFARDWEEGQPGAALVSRCGVRDSSWTLGTEFVLHCRSLSSFNCSATGGLRRGRFL